MSWSETRAQPTRRSLALASLALVLTGCGFHPLYAPRGPQDWDRDLAAIDVRPIVAGRPGQLLELALRENLNPGGASVPTRWLLSTTLVVSRADLGIQRNATATTSELSVTVQFFVKDPKTFAIIYSSSSAAVGDFDLVADAYATQVAADAARDRAIKEVADEMTLRLTLFVQAQREKAAGK